MAQVFVCRDFALDALLDDIAAALAERGIAVRRGPPSTSGQKLTYPREDWERLFGDVDVAMFSSRSIASRELLQSAPRLRAVINPTIGLETVDVDAASELGIIVGHGAVPENYIGMAEATVMLMLNLRYQLRASEEVLRGARPQAPAHADHVHARMLRGCTIGLIGMGRIARAVVERLRPFGVSFLGYAPSTPAEDWPADVQRLEMRQVLARSDIVGLFASVNAGSRGLVGEAELACMQPHAYVVNTARGELVDEDALYRALRNRRIAGAALDVFTVEPLPGSSPLRTLDNVILTPHLIGHTREVFQAFVPAAVENITRVLRGQLPLYCRNPGAEGRWRERLRGFENSE